MRLDRQSPDKSSRDFSRRFYLPLRCLFGLRLDHSNRHYKTFRLCKILLIPVKGEEMGSIHLQCTGHVENIESAVTSCESANGRDSLGLINHIGKVGSGYDQSALVDGGFESGPTLNCRPRRNSTSKLGEPQGVSELKMGQAVEVQRYRVPRRPCHSLGTMNVVSVE